MRNEEPVVAETLSADVIIIGAGVAGALAAWELAGKGHKVLVLDAGPSIDRVEALERFRASSAKGSNAPYENTWYAPQPADNNPENYYLQNGPTSFLGQYVRGVGGTSWHWTGHAERHYPNDFQMLSAYGVGVNWPITYDVLLPYYQRVEAEWGVSGDPADYIGPDRHGEGFPLPRVPMSYLDHQVGQAAAAAGYAFGPYPHARNSVPHDGRPQCCGNASCRYLCPIAAKYDASVHVVKAQARGARVLDKRVVYSIEVNDDERALISGVRYRHPDGWEGRATGKTYILAAHAIETPKLLLLSTSRRTPQGVANQSGQVGRNLIALADVNTMALAPKPLFPYRGPVSATGGLKSLRDGLFRQQHAAIATNFANGGWDAALGPANRAKALIAKGIFGSELSARLADETAREVTLGSMVDVLPDPNNRIVPDATQKDGLGIPRPRITFGWDDYTRRGIEVARAMHLDILKAMGVDTTTAITPEPEVDTAVIAGTTRMGTEPTTSVVDGYCRSHDHRNLYIIGTGAYPTTGIVSPSMSAAALALRAAEQIHANAGQG